MIISWLIDLLSRTQIKILPREDIEQEIDEEVYEHSEYPVSEGGLGGLYAQLQQDGSLEITCLWDKDSVSPELATALGTMLKFLTSGGYDALISKSLESSFQESNKDTQEFITQVLSIWQTENMEKLTTELKQAPVISPLRTFGESNFGGMPG